MEVVILMQVLLLMDYLILVKILVLLQDGMILLGQEQNLLGTMSGVSVSGFLKLVENESMTCICEVQSEDGKRGYLVFEGGTLYNAFYGKLKGKDAAINLFKLDKAKIKFRHPPKKKFPRQIKSSLSSLIREAEAT